MMIEKRTFIRISFLGLLQIPHNFPRFPPTDFLERGYHTETDDVNDSKSDTNSPRSPSRQVQDRLGPPIDREQPKKPSEILPFFLSCHQEFLLVNLRRRRPFGFKGQLEMADHV
jgi:hypothetical protein